MADAAADTAAPRVLLLDDDIAYAAELSAYLDAHGCVVRTTASTQRFESELIAFEPDLILLDQRLGETTGTDVLRRIRQRIDTPCIVVTGLSDQTDRIVNLEIGADDQIDKSLSARELLARIRAVLRRHARPSRRAPAPSPPPPQPSKQPGAGRWVLSVPRRELFRPDGSLCRLTTAEFETLRLLHQNAGSTVSRAYLNNGVFGRSLTPGDRAVDTVVRKLRRKLSPAGGDGGIKTIRPTGYAFVGFPEDTPSKPGP